MRYTDYYVRPMEESEIEAIALKWRAATTTERWIDYFNIVDFIQKVLRPSLKRHGAPLTVKYLHKSYKGPPAYVTFKPFVLHVRADVWTNAWLGDALCRYILAHECGHIILHDEFAKAFSDDSKARLPADEILRSAEWQADTFADHFTMPMSIIERLHSAGEIVVRCGIDLSNAQRRFAAVSDYWLRNGRPCGDECDQCLDNQTLRIADRVRCKPCQRMVGFCP